MRWIKNIKAGHLLPLMTIFLRGKIYKIQIYVFIRYTDGPKTITCACRGLDMKCNGRLMPSSGEKGNRQQKISSNLKSEITQNIHYFSHTYTSCEL